MYHILTISRFIPSTVVKSGRYNLAFASFSDGLSSIAQNPQYFFNSQIHLNSFLIERARPFISFSNTHLDGLTLLANAFKHFYFVSSFVILSYGSRYSYV